MIFPLRSDEQPLHGVNITSAAETLALCSIVRFGEGGEEVVFDGRGRRTPKDTSGENGVIMRLPQLSPVFFSPFNPVSVWRSKGPATSLPTPRTQFTLTTYTRLAFSEQRCFPHNLMTLSRKTARLTSPQSFNQQVVRFPRGRSACFTPYTFQYKLLLEHAGYT